MTNNDNSSQPVNVVPPADVDEFETILNSVLPKMSELRQELSRVGAHALAERIAKELAGYRRGDVARSELAAAEMRMGCGEWIDEFGRTHLV